MKRFLIFPALSLALATQGCKTVQQRSLDDSSALNEASTGGGKGTAVGEANGRSFHAEVRHQSNAVVQWDDGAQALYLVVESNPILVPRCPCIVYSGRDESNQIVELSVGYKKRGDGSVEISKSATLNIILPVKVGGKYEGTSFEVAVYEGHHAELSSSSATLGMYMPADANPPLPPLPLSDFSVYSRQHIDGRTWQLNIKYEIEGGRRVLQKVAELVKVPASPFPIKSKGAWKGFDYSVSIVKGKYADISWQTGNHGEENVRMVFDQNPPLSIRGTARAAYTYLGQDGYMRLLFSSMDGKSSIFMKLNPQTLRED